MGKRPPRGSLVGGCIGYKAERGAETRPVVCPGRRTAPGRTHGPNPSDQSGRPAAFQIATHWRGTRQWVAMESKGRGSGIEITGIRLGNLVSLLAQGG